MPENIEQATAAPGELRRLPNRKANRADIKQAARRLLMLCDDDLDDVLCTLREVTLEKPYAG